VNQREFQLVREIFENSLTLSSSEREPHLALAGPVGSPLRNEVEFLLREATHAGTFLETPAVADNAAADLAAQASATLSDPLLGRNLGGYIIERLIGMGGMGRVYEAKQLSPARRVAIKVLAAANVSSGSRIRLQHEASLLARLRHPGIAQIYEAGTSADGIAFLAMEFLGNAEPITVFSARQNLPVRSRLELFCLVCDAVHHGHQRGVIHRDLKPSNILVEPGTAGEPALPRIIDFGIARLTDPLSPDQPHHTATGQFIGTLAYASPEQCGNDPHDLDTRADVYALGVVLFELLTSSLPIEVNGLALVEAASRVRDITPPRLGQLRPELTGDLETIVGKALSKDRAARYGAAADLAADVRRYLASEPIEARPPSVAYKARLFARRHRAALAAATTAAAVLFVSAVGGLLLAAHAMRQAAAAESARNVATAQRDRAVRVSDFLQGALGSANPDLPMRVSPEARAASFEPFADWRMSPWEFAGEPGRAATVVDVLRAASDRLDAAFEDQRADRAALGVVLGRSLYNLGASAAAGATLKRALADARESFGMDHEVTILCTLRYAEYLGFFESTIPRDDLFTAARNSAERIYGPADARTLEVLRQEAYDLFTWRGKPKEGADMLLAAVERARTLGLDRTEGALSSQGYAAFLLDWAGEHDRATAMARLTLADLETQTGTDSLATAESARILGQILRRRTQLASSQEAAKLLLRSSDLFARHFGESSRRASSGYAETAQAYMAALDASSAEAPARKAAEGLAKLLGEERYESAGARATLAGVLMNIGGHPEEQRRLADSARRSIALSVDEPADFQWSLRLISAHAGLALGEQSAAALMRSVIDEGDSRLTLSDVLRARPRIELASFLHSQGNTVDCRALLDESRGLLDTAAPTPSHTRRAFDAVAARAGVPGLAAGDTHSQPSK